MIIPILNRGAMATPEMLTVCFLQNYSRRKWWARDREDYIRIDFGGEAYVSDTKVVVYFSGFK